MESKRQPPHPPHPSHHPHPHPPHQHPHQVVCTHDRSTSRPHPHSYMGLPQGVPVWPRPGDYSMDAAGPSMPMSFMPMRYVAASGGDLGSTVELGKRKFQINLDVQHFTEEEITVKIVDGFIVVECKQEEKKDDQGFVSRQLTRRYELPEGCLADAVESKLSSDGMLIVVAPRKAPSPVQGEREIPITRTGPLRKENELAGGDPA